MKDRFEQEPIDPRLMEYLKLLKMVPPRDPKAAARTQAKFLSELETVFASGARESAPFLSLRSDSAPFLPKRTIIVSSMKRTVTALIAVILLVFVFVFGGVGVTARAARSALPGDALYSVKTRIEQARLSLAHDLSKEAELNMEFASTRLAEIGRLIEAGRYEEAVSLSTEFNAYIQKALQAVGELAKLDPVKAGELSAEITSKLLEYTQKLSAMLAGLPESVSNEIKNNFPAPELSPPGQGNENSNSNENANENEDTNENESVNENDDGGNQNDNGGDDIDHDDGNDDDRDGGNVNDHDGGDDDDGGGDNDHDDGGDNDYNGGNVNDHDGGDDDDGGGDNDDGGGDNDHNGGGDNDSGDSDNENSSNGDG